MPRINRPALGLFISLLLLSGCAGLQSGFEPPTVSVTSFRALPGQGVMPRFEIGLHIINPNRQSLALKGIAYTIRIEGHRILTGVSNTLPVIDAYGEGDVRLEAEMDLISGIQFFTDLAREKHLQSLTYSLEAKLDTGALTPVIRVEKTGRFNLDPNRRQNNTPTPKGTLM